MRYDWTNCLNNIFICIPVLGTEKKTNHVSKCKKETVGGLQKVFVTVIIALSNGEQTNHLRKQKHKSHNIDKGLLL
jgi:hypothetical protein